jgi:hypothetical protein
MAKGAAPTSNCYIRPLIQRDGRPVAGDALPEVYNQSQMRKTMLSVGILLLCFVLQGGERIALGPEKLTLEQLTQAAKHYFRDTVEFPLAQKMTFTATDPTGRVKKVEHVTAQYVFKGYNPNKQVSSGQLRGEISMWAAMGGAKMFKAAFNSGLWTMFAGQILLTDSGEYSFESGDTGDGNELIIANMNHLQPCAMFIMSKRAQWYGPDHVCGASEYQLLRDLSFQKFTFDQAGLPAPVKMEPFGNCMLRRYHAEVEFQKVMVPEDKEPFLVPKQVTATLETDKGTIVIFSVYEPKAAATH